MAHSDFQMHGAADDEQLTGYRPVSMLAVASLVLGLLSAVGAVSTYFVWLPLVPILVGAAALYQIHRGQGEYLGRKAAVIGMVLGGLFLGLQLGQLAHSHRMAYQEARRFADGWLKLLADGRWEAADQATMARSRRSLSARTVVAGYAADPKLQKQWQQFVTDSPLCRRLIDWGPDTKIRWVRNLQQRYLKDQRAVQMLYEITPPGQQPLEARIWVVRDTPIFNQPATWWTRQLERVE